MVVPTVAAANSIVFITMFPQVTQVLYQSAERGYWYSGYFWKKGFGLQVLEGRLYYFTGPGEAVILFQYFLLHLLRSVRGNVLFYTKDFVAERFPELSGGPPCR